MLLDVQNLNAGLEDGKQILNDLNIQIGQGETHVLMGPNGAGKSSLGNALMGNPVYKITGGKILFKGEDITNLSADKAYDIDAVLADTKVKSVKGEIVSGKIDAHNTFAKPNTVKVKKFDDVTFKGNELKIKIPSGSVLHLEVTV